LLEVKDSDLPLTSMFPLEIYRNPYLAEVMVSLNMIDTQGGGIKRMFQAQRRRFFPLPDDDLSQPERVMVTLRGRILDLRYTRLQMAQGELDLATIMLLDNMQKAQHIRNRGFDSQYYRDMIVALVREHQPVSREGIATEFKSARGGVANTQGGTIVLGVAEKPAGLVLEGVPDAAQLRTVLWGQLNDRHKVSSNLLRDDDMCTVAGVAPPVCGGECAACLAAAAAGVCGAQPHDGHFLVNQLYPADISAMGSSA